MWAQTLSESCKNGFVYSWDNNGWVAKGSTRKRKKLKRHLWWYFIFLIVLRFFTLNKCGLQKDAFCSDAESGNRMKPFRVTVQWAEKNQLKFKLRACAALEDPSWSDGFWDCRPCYTFVAKAKGRHILGLLRDNSMYTEFYVIAYRKNSTFVVLIRIFFQRTMRNIEDYKI